jgi:serine/threonine-protein kinase
VTPATSLALGDRYRLLDRLAVGGMGEIWCAEDQVLGRSVAVKILREEHAGDPTFRRRFRDEAQHAALLVHPNVAQVFDFCEGDEAAGVPPYLVMELVRGEPLSAVIEREAPLDAEQTFSILGQAASALAAAHDAGVVHRDIKPANLLVCPDGGLKVTDFGIARAAGSSAVTTAGTLYGTPHYVSPEQVSGETVTGASDFYALGVVAYECLTGVRMFDGEAMTVLLAHRDRPAPPLPPGVPAGLRDLVAAMLDKDPAKRPTDGRGIAAQAERFNAPTVSIPVVLDAYPDEAQRGAADPGATGVLPPTDGVLTGPATGVAVTGLPAQPPVAPRRRRGLLIGSVALAAVAALAVALVVVGIRGGGGPAKKGATSPAPPKPVRVASVQPYAGGGGSADHPEEASLATDGKVSTSWYTQHYASAAFGGLRNGTGLLFDLGRPVTVRTLQLDLSVAGVRLQVHAADSVGALLSSPVVGSSPSAPPSMTLHPGATARYWLVWFTKLAPNDGRFRAGIAEASFAR